MSSKGAPLPRVLDGSGLRIAIVASSWHEVVMNSLISGAEKYLRDSNSAFDLYRVPGSFELPLASQKAFDMGYDAVIALGLVIRGDTPHFDYVCDGVTRGLMDIMINTKKPIGFGVLTCENEDQAIARSGLPGASSNKGVEAAHAAIAMAILSREMNRDDF